MFRKLLPVVVCLAFVQHHFSADAAKSCWKENENSIMVKDKCTGLGDSETKCFTHQCVSDKGMTHSIRTSRGCTPKDKDGCGTELNRACRGDNGESICHTCDADYCNDAVAKSAKPALAAILAVTSALFKLHFS